MSFAVSIPQNLKYKRFNKRFSRISSVCESNFNQVASGSSFICGLKCLEGGFLSVHQIHQYILLLRRAIGKGRIGWSRLRLHMNVKIPKTSKSAGHRMGKGKGAVRFWGMAIRKGAFVFKIKKSPFKFHFIDSFSWSFIFAIEEFVETYSFVVLRYKRYVTLYQKNKFSFNLLRAKTSFYVMSLIHYFKQLFTIKRKFLKKFMLLFVWYITSRFTPYFKRLVKSRRKNLFSTKKSNYTPFFVLQTAHLFRKLTYTQVVYKRKTVFLKKRVRLWLIKKVIYYLWMATAQTLERSSQLWDIDPLELDADYLETKAYIEKFQKYPDFRISYLPSLFRGLFRIKKKVPFRSEIVFFGDKTSVFSSIAIKRETLKHINQK